MGTNDMVPMCIWWCTWKFAHGVKLYYHYFGFTKWCPFMTAGTINMLHGPVLGFPPRILQPWSAQALAFGQIKSMPCQNESATFVFFVGLVVVLLLPGSYVLLLAEGIQVSNGRRWNSVSYLFMALAWSLLSWQHTTLFCKFFWLLVELFEASYSFWQHLQRCAIVFILWYYCWA